MTCRPEILAQVGVCCRYMAKPTKRSVELANRLWRYLATTPNHGIRYACRDPGEHQLSVSLAASVLRLGIRRCNGSSVRGRKGEQCDRVGHSVTASAQAGIRRGICSVSSSQAALQAALASSGQLRPASASFGQLRPAPASSGQLRPASASFAQPSASFGRRSVLADYSTRSTAQCVTVCPQAEREPGLRGRGERQSLACGEGVAPPSSGCARDCGAVPPESEEQAGGDKVPG